MSSAHTKGVHSQPPDPALDQALSDLRIRCRRRSHGRVFAEINIHGHQVVGVRMQEDALTWEDVRRLRDLWPRRLLVKGVLLPEDALRAKEAGADGVVVSNHGGRQLDSAPAPIETLAAVRQAKTVTSRGASITPSSCPCCCARCRRCVSASLR